MVTAATLLNVSLDVETRDGGLSSGFGSMPLGNAWAWPSTTVPVDQALAAMILLGERIGNGMVDGGWGHPLELMHEFAPRIDTLAVAVMRDMQLPEPIAPLAVLVAGSPTDAALHDAYGKALGQNSYDLLGAEHMNHDLSRYLDNFFAGEFLDRYTLRGPKPSMPLYHLVGVSIRSPAMTLRSL